METGYSDETETIDHHIWLFQLKLNLFMEIGSVVELLKAYFETPVVFAVCVLCMGVVPAAVTRLLLQAAVCFFDEFVCCLL